MPVYVYKRDDDGTTFEAEQSIHEDPFTDVYDPFNDLFVTVRRVPQPPAIALKGKGFYRTGG